MVQLHLAVDKDWILYSITTFLNSSVLWFFGLTYWDIISANFPDPRKDNKPGYFDNIGENNFPSFQYSLLTIAKTI